MKLPNTDIERAAARDDIRLYLTHVHLDVENQRIVATNGVILASVPCEVDEGDTTGPISRDAIKAARKGPKKSEATILANGSLSVPAAGVTFSRPTEDGQFPNYQRVMVRAEDRPSIAIDADQLVDLASALNRRNASRNGVRLYLPKRGDEACKVEPMEGEPGAEGVLMLMRDDGVGAQRYEKLDKDQAKLATAKELLAQCLSTMSEARFMLPEHEGLKKTLATVEQFLMAK